MADEEAYPLATTEGLRLALHDCKWWRAERLRGQSWERCKHRLTANGKIQQTFSADLLSVDAFRSWWGAGIYKLVLSLGPGKRARCKTQPFEVTEGDDELELEGDGGELERPAAPSGANGNGNGAHSGRAWFRGMPTNIGKPPLTATRYDDYVRTRDTSPMEIFMCMFPLVKDQLEEHRAAEERRSREFMAMMNLREKQIEMDAQVRIAEANARSDAEREHAAHLRAEADRMRELAAAAQTAAQTGNKDDLNELLDQLTVAIESLAEEEDEDEPTTGAAMAAQIVGGLMQHIGPELGPALAKRIAGGDYQGRPAGAMDGGIADSIDAGGDADADS